MRRFSVAAAALLAMAIVTTACNAKDKPRLTDNSACWDDPTDVRVDVSCTLLTEKLLLSLRLATRETVVKAMKAEGRPINNAGAAGLHFLSAARHGTGDISGEGDLNVTFRDNLAVIISANIDRPDEPRGFVEYIWNAELGGCSDFPGSNEKCSK